MTTYRTNGSWGAGIGRDLSPVEVDNNFWDLVQRMLAQEARPDPSAGIDGFSVSGTDFYVHMSDGMLYGPYPLPIAMLNGRGAWQPATAYTVMDTVDSNGNLYMVAFTHVSGAVFDPGANDGAGHSYYSLMLASPGNSFPTGGGTGMSLIKSSGADFATTWDYVLPEGGSVGQALVKSSALLGDASWGSVPATNVSFDSTGDLVSTNVGAALDEVALLAGGTPAAVDVTYDNTDTEAIIPSLNVQGAITELATKLAADSVIGMHTIWVPAATMTPRLTNGPAANVIEFPIRLSIYKTLDFDAVTPEMTMFEIMMPNSWNKQACIVEFYWSHAATTTNFNVLWSITAQAIPPTTTLDWTYTGGSNDMQSTGGTANALYKTGQLGFTVRWPTGSSGITDGDLIQFRIYRAPTDARDTMAVDARLHGVAIYYDVTKGKDL